MPSWLDQIIGPGVVAAVLGFFGVRALNRIDALEKHMADKANRSDVTALIDELRAEREASRESRGKLYERVNGIGESLARLEGRLGK